MDSAVDALTLGIEEEYLLVDPQTGDLARDPPGGQLVACEKLVSLRALYAEATELFGSEAGAHWAQALSAYDASAVTG